MRNNKYLLLLILITIIAVFPRAAVVFNPYNYFFDPEQGVEYLVTKSIVVDHQVVLTSHQGGFGGFSKGPGFNYLLVIPFILFNGNPFGGRILMFAISILSVVFSFVLTNRIFNLRTAVLISFLLAISPGLKDYAGAISPPFIIPLVTVFFIFFIYKVLRKELTYIYPLVFSAGLMVHFESAAAGILTALLALTGLVCFAKKSIPIRYYLLSVGSFAVAILPLIVFDIFNRFYNTLGVIGMITAIKNQIPNHSGLNFSSFIDNRLEVFIWTYISTFSPNLIIWLFLLIILIIGIIFFLKDKKVKQYKKLFISYLAIIPIFTLILLFIYPGEVANQWWITYLAVIYCFLLGVVLDYFLKKNIPLKALVVIMLFVLSFAYLKRTFFIYKTQFSYPPSTYIKEDHAIKYVFNDAKKHPFGILVYSKRTQENYDYLIWWNDKTQYQNQPHREKKGLYYIVIEPNIVFSLKEEKALDNLRVGRLIETKELSNGFTIEKRVVK